MSNLASKCNLNDAIPADKKRKIFLNNMLHCFYKRDSSPEAYPCFRSTARLFQNGDHYLSLSRRAASAKLDMPYASSL